MDQFNLKRPPILEPSTGRLLIAEPFLKDGHFSRTVILLCEYADDGTLGFVLNQNTDMVLGDIVVELSASRQPIFQGGPVQDDTLHMIHSVPNILGGKQIGENTFWGGDFEVLKEAILTHQIAPDQLRLFLGYAGWSWGQLEAELAEGSWLVANANTDIVFNTPPQDVWKKAIDSLGKDYRYLSQLPIDPQLN